MCELELFWCQATFASDFRTFRDVIPHDSRWFLSVLSRFPRLHLSELQLHQHPPDVPDKLRWSSCRTVELCETLWNCFSAPGSHGCQWHAIYANGHSRASVTNKSKWSASVSAALVFTQIIDLKKTMCIASLLPSEHISWYLWHFPSSTRPTWEYDSFNWHRWRPLILTRDLI